MGDLSSEVTLGTGERVTPNEEAIRCFFDLIGLVRRS